MARLAGSASLVLVDGATPLRPEPALFDAMIAGWCRQHSARRLSPTITRQRVRVVQRFKVFSGAWPWEWTAAQADAWVSQGAWAHSTVRNYQGSLALFLAYICDPRYGWPEACLERVGVRTDRGILDERNTSVHVADYEGRPGRRPFTRAELQALFDTADAAVEEAAGSPRKGWLAAFRDATLIKVTYGWGLRCRETAMLDVGDFGPNPAAAELGGYGICHVRFGKAMRGSPTRPADQSPTSSPSGSTRSVSVPDQPGLLPCSNSPASSPAAAPGPNARHPHKRRRQMAASVQRGLDQLRSRSQPPGQLQHPSGTG